MNMGQERHMQMAGGNGSNQLRQYAGQNARNQIRYNAGQNARIQIGQNVGQNQEEREINVNYIFMANLQQASTSGTHTDTTLIVDSDGSAEVHQYGNSYNNEIFYMFSEEEKYIELLKSTTDTYLEQHSDSNIIHEASYMDPSGGQVKQHQATIEETRTFYESLYNKLVNEVEKVNMVDRETRNVNE
nr:hypothetical protein [Tanacetum cinerariifolium]